MMWRSVILILLILTSASYAADSIKVTICPPPSDCDYTSFDAAESAHDQDLVSNDSTFFAEFDSVWNAVTTGWGITGWTTGASNNIYITATGQARTTGIYGAPGYRLEVSTNQVVNNLETYVTIDGFQFYMTHAAQGNHGIDISSVTSGTILIKNCIIRANPAYTGTQSQWGIRGMTGGDLQIHNCVFYDWMGSNSLQAAVRADNDSTFIYNSTFINNRTDVRVMAAGDVVVIQNSLFAASIDQNEEEGGRFGAATDYNSTDSADFGEMATNTNDNVNQTFTFQDAANDTFYITSADAGARELGTPITGRLESFTDDIAGRSRPISTNWDIGFYEADAPGAPPDKLQYRRREERRR